MAFSFITVKSDTVVYYFMHQMFYNPQLKTGPNKLAKSSVYSSRACGWERYCIVGFDDVTSGNIKCDDDHMLKGTLY